jgi:hypothetical protein
VTCISTIARLIRSQTVVVAPFRHIVSPPGRHDLSV